MSDKDKEPLPPFDDSRKAATFALNAHDVEMPRPAMNAAMSRGIKKRQSKAAAKREAKVRRERQLAETGSYSDEPDVLDGTRRGNPAASARGEAQRAWLGLARPAQAGLILQVMGKLDREQLVVLTGLLVRPATPCSCRSACCSGWARSPRWQHAVAETCQLVKESMDLVRVPGKKGLSTHPEMRRAIIEAHYRAEPAPLAALAHVAGVTPITAAKHRAWITEALARIEQEAWVQLDALFDQHGITGMIVP